jgi:hypothetical protein
VVTSDTEEQVRKSSESRAIVKLASMLRSMSRRFPKTNLLSTAGAFGVSLGDGDSLHIVYNGDWTAEELRSFLVLFAGFLSADPERLLRGRRTNAPQAGVSLTDLSE